MRNVQEGHYRELAGVLREWASSYAPDWTDVNDGDPGITLLQLFAFVTESLVANSAAMPERARLAAARLARSALVLAGGEGHAQGGALVRNRYFSGRLLSAEDFQLEQDYVRGRLRRHNRRLHGACIVHGLQASVRPGSSGQQVVVQPGFALAPDGEEIEVPCEASVSLPETARELSLVLSYAERLTGPVSAPDQGQVQFTRVEDSFALHVESTPGRSGVVLARLIRTAAGWEVDPALSPPRVQCCGD